MVLHYVDSQFPEHQVRHPDPLHHAIESMLGLMDSKYARAGYAMLLNRDGDKRETCRQAFDAEYDYSRGVGGGALVDGRRKSSFAMDPHWSARPMPPRDKWGEGATDTELGLA